MFVIGIYEIRQHSIGLLAFLESIGTPGYDGALGWILDRNGLPEDIELKRAYVFVGDEAEWVLESWKGTSWCIGGSACKRQLFGAEAAQSRPRSRYYLGRFLEHPET